MEQDLREERLRPEKDEGTRRIASGVPEESFIQELAGQALQARARAYVPYSHFAVGAALLAKNGTVFQGCNIENASFGVTNCAERTAIFKAVSEGIRDFTAIAVAGGREDAPPTDYCPPCGVCRQVMAEFCGSDFKICLIKSETEVRVVTLSDLLPMRFDNLDDIPEND